MCECCNSDAEHELAMAEQMAYWSRYFGDSVKSAAASERFYREEGIDVNDVEALRRLK